MDDNTHRADQDRELVANVLASQQGAFALLIERHQKLVWHLVYRMVHNPDDCKELCQEVFLRVHKNLQSFRFESKLSTWIGRIAFNISSRHLQRKQLPLIAPGDDDICPTETIADDVDLAAAFEDEDLLMKLHKALESLAPVPRTILTLHYLDELSISEVAEILEKPEGTVKNSLFRARAILREKFAYYLEVTDAER